MCYRCRFDVCVVNFEPSWNDLEIRGSVVEEVKKGPFHKILWTLFFFLLSRTFFLQNKEVEHLVSYWNSIKYGFFWETIQSLRWQTQALKVISDIILSFIFSPKDSTFETRKIFIFHLKNCFRSWEILKL